MDTRDTSSRTASWPRVSVVIPTYNRASWITDAILSVLDQSYPNLEVIVVDDGSTDDTQSAVARFGNAVRYLRQENAGAAAARNRGVQAATGELVAFLDSDDLFVTGKLHEQVQYFRRNPETVFAYCWFSVVDDSGRARLGRRCELEGHVADQLLARCMQGPLATPTVMARRNALLESGGFDETMQLSEDVDLWCRLSRMGPIGLIPEVLVRVRRHGGNLSRGAGGRRYRDASLRILRKAFAVDRSISPFRRGTLIAKAYAWSWMALAGSVLPPGLSFWLRALLTNPLSLLTRRGTSAAEPSSLPISHVGRPDQRRVA